MLENEYIYRMKPLVVPGSLYIILYPLLVGGLSYLLNISDQYIKIFSTIYIISALAILLIWLVAKSKKVMFEDNLIIFRSLAGQYTLEPKDIIKATFFRTPRREEAVQIKSSNKVFYLSNLYFPFNELLTDLEEFISKYNVRSNLANYHKNSL